MKKNRPDKQLLKINYLIIIFSIFILCSCDFGLSSGEDIIGKWTPSNNYYQKFITFKDDETGFYESEKDDNKWVAKDFDWSVVQGIVYKKIITDIGDYDYYFSLDKQTLYLDDNADGIFDEWKIFRKY